MLFKTIPSVRTKVWDVYFLFNTSFLQIYFRQLSKCSQSSTELVIMTQNRGFWGNHTGIVKNVNSHWQYYGWRLHGNSLHYYLKSKTVKYTWYHKQEHVLKGCSLDKEKPKSPRPFQKNNKLVEIHRIETQWLISTSTSQSRALWYVIYHVIFVPLVSFMWCICCCICHILVSRPCITFHY